MIRRSVHSLAVLVGAVVVAASAPFANPLDAHRADGSPPPQEEGLTCERMPELMRAYLKQHVRFHYLSAEIKSRTASNYVERIDPSRSLLLRSDVDAVESQVQDVFRDLRDANCDRLLAIHRDMLARYRSMEDYVRSVVMRPDYAIDGTARIAIDPAKRGFPATAEDQQHLYRRLIDFQMANYVSAGTPLEEAKGHLVHRYELISRRVDEEKPSDLYADFLHSFATALDPHSWYLSPDYFEDFQIGMGLSLEGIGVALGSRDGYAVVEKVIPGGATDRAKALKPKDKIIAVAQDQGDFVDVIDMALRDVVRLIRGRRGTKVHLRVLRQEDATRQFTVTIVRDKIDLEESAASLHWQTREREGRKLKLAVIDLPAFYGDQAGERQSSEDVRHLLDQVNKEHADGLLIDLSRNGGGLLDSGIEIAGFFIRRGGVVAVKDTYANTKVLDDPDPGIVYSGPLVLLTSRMSASASEIVAGALKDYHRAIVVGDGQTFGKGTVQSVVRLPPDLGALKVTTALFFRPGGDSTQLDGVRSDIVLPSPFEVTDLGEKESPNALGNERIDPFRDPAANKASDGYREVDPAMIARLAKLSAARVEHDPEFAKLADQLAKARAHDGVVTVSEILDGHKDTEDADPEASDDAAQAEASPQLREAVDILADYVELSPS